MDGKIFVTSDLHFNHNKDFIWRDRGFESINEMNEEIISRWNSVVGANDDIYVLGDLMLGDNESGINCLRRLNGRIHVVLGNHDTPVRQSIYLEMPNIVEVEWAIMLPYKKYHFFLTHYPCMTGNYDDKSLKYCVINLCGHIHTKNKYRDMDKGLIYHVDLDAHNCYPVLLDDVIEELKSLPRPAKPIEESRCGNCAHGITCRGFYVSNSNGACPDYVKDPPDGGFYG